MHYLNKIDYFSVSLNQIIILKKHFLIVALGIFFSILIASYLIESQEESNAFYATSTLIFIACLGVLISYITYFLTLVLDKLLPWETQTGNRFLAGLFCGFLVVFLVSVFAFYGYDLLFLSNNSFLENNEQTVIKLAILIFILMLMYGVIYFALYSYYTFATLQIETVKQERKQIDLQLKALKSQLSPHFLFNSLNTISSLAFRNVDKTTFFIRKLAKMYMYTLSSYHIKMISLEEELAFAKSYIYLITTRLEDTFSASIELSESVLKSKIPPLTLQMLLENVVKHNVMDATQKLKVRIYEEENMLCVQNNITEKPANVTSFHIGLKNINSRYLLLAKKGIIVSNGTNFTVKIPLLK